MSTVVKIIVDRSSSVQPTAITGQAIVKNEVTQIDTQQSAREPRIVSFYDTVSGKNIDKSLPGWSSRLDTTWFIDIPAQLKEYTNVTVYYL